MIYLLIFPISLILVLISFFAQISKEKEPKIEIFLNKKPGLNPGFLFKVLVL